MQREGDSGKECGKGKRGEEMRGVGDREERRGERVGDREERREANNRENGSGKIAWKRNDNEGRREERGRKESWRAGG